MDEGTRPFIGRRYELDRVRRAVDGRARLVVLEGDAGMGKTRLLRESMSVIAPEVVRFEGAAEPYDARLLGPIRDAVAPAVNGWSRVPEPLRRHRAAIEALFPAGATPAHDDEAALPSQVLTDSILAIVQHAVGGQHGVLVLDDMQWADSDVLAVLSRLVRSRLPCTTIVTSRPLAHEGDHLVQFFADLRRSVDAEHLELAPLDVAEVGDLLRRTVGLAATSFAVDVHERTGGHPFLIRQLLDTGQLSSTADAFDLPRTVSESTRRTLLRLSNDGRAVVEAAATLGRTATFQQLGRFTGFSEARLLSALQQLCDERLLTEVAADEFGFAHVLAQQAVNESIVSRQRRRLHARALDVLPADTDPLDIVRHADEAGTPERGVDSVRSAATRAMDSGHIGRAYRLAAAGSALAPNDRELAEIHAMSAWHTGRAGEARDVAIDLLGLTAPDDSRTRIRMLWLIARVAIESGQVAEFDDALSQLIALIDQVPDEQRRDLVMRIAETTMVASRVDALAWAERAYAESETDPELHAAARINLGSALTDVPGRREEGRRLLRAAVVAARSAGPDLDRARALNNLLSEVVYVDEAADALGLLDELDAHLLASGLAPRMGDNAVLWRGVLAERQGDLAAARAAVSWFGPAAPERTSCLVWFKAMLELSAGDLVACRIELDREPPARPEYHGQFELVDLERAVRCDERPLEGIAGPIFELHATRSRYMLDHIDQLGRAAVAIARVAAQRAPDVAGEIADRWQTALGHDPDAISVLSHLAAIRAESSGDFGQALDLYARSLVGLPRRSATMMADAHLGLARCHEAVGDRRAARASASCAVTLLERWPGPDQDAAKRLLRSLGGRPRRADGPSTLSEREREVAELVGRGLTNKEIGLSLFISGRTVGVHIQHIMGKLDLAKRAEIAAYMATNRAS